MKRFDDFECWNCGFSYNIVYKKLNADVIARERRGARLSSSSELDSPKSHRQRVRLETNEEARSLSQRPQLSRDRPRYANDAQNTAGGWHTDNVHQTIRSLSKIFGTTQYHQ